MTPEEKREIRLQERARMRAQTPYYDMTFSAEKSVSLMHAGLRAAAKRARDEQRGADAERFEAQAAQIEAAVMAGADEMLGLAERRAAIVRTGHHSASSGEFRDAAGFVAVKFPQHTSRADDPQLHVQTTVLNKAQRADGADDRWRALDGRPLWRERLGLAAHAGMREAQELARLGLPLVKREDGNGFEVGGVSQATQDAFSSRAAKIEAELADLLIEYKEMYGRAPDRAALYKLRKQVTLGTRQAKHKPKQSGSETPQDRAARRRRGAGGVDPQGAGRERPGARSALRSGGGVRGGASRSAAGAAAERRGAGTGDPQGGRRGAAAERRVDARSARVGALPAGARAARWRRLVRVPRRHGGRRRERARAGRRT